MAVKANVVQRRPRAAVRPAARQADLAPGRPFAAPASAPATPVPVAGRGHDFARVTVSAAAHEPGRDVGETDARAGREGSPVPVAMPRGPQPIQRALAVNGAAIPKDLHAKLKGSVKRFNKHYGKKNVNTQHALHQQFAMLDGIERRVNRHLRDNSANIGDAQRTELFSLLNQTQQHHAALTARNVAQGHDLWLRDGPQLGRDERDRRQGLWKSLVAGTGNVKVATKDDEFRNRTHAGFAKLLQGAHGTGLLAGLNDAGADAEAPDASRNIVISDDHSIDQRDSYAAHRPLESEGSWADNVPGKKGARGAYVQVAHEAPPATLGAHESDTAGKALFAPDFITLGHELGHARHIQQGTIRREEWPEDHALPARERPMWTNLEEHANITGEENPIRAENDLPERRYHGTIDVTRGQGHKFDLNQRLDGLFATVPEAHRKALGGQFSDLSGAIDKTDLTQPHHVAALTNQIDQLEEDLPGKVRSEKIKAFKASVRSALTPTIPKVVGAVGAAAATGLWLWNRQQEGQ